MNNPDLSRDPILVCAFQLAWPLLFTLSVGSLISMNDMYLSAKIGAAAQAAVGVGDQVLYLTAVVATGLAAGGGSLIARALGAGKNNLAAHYTLASLFTGIIFSVISAAAVYFFAGPTLDLFGVAPEVKRLGMPFLEICALGNIPYVIWIVQASILRSAGKTRLCLAQGATISLMSCAFSLSLFTWDVFAVKGTLAALALGWDLGCSLAVLFGFHLISIKKDRLSARLIVLIARQALKILAIGIPAMFAEAGILLSNFLMYRLLASMPQPTDLQAAWTIRMKVEESLASTPMLAISMSLATMVGHNLGAGKAARAREATRRLGMASFILMSLIGCMLALAAESIGSAMAGKGAVAAALTFLLRGAAATMPLYAISSIFFAALEGAGKTRAAMFINLVVLAGIRAPLCAWLSLQLSLGLSGLMAGIIASAALLALCAWAAGASGCKDGPRLIKSLNRQPI